MMHSQIEHPADFEKDAVLFAGLTITQVFFMAPVIAVGVFGNLGLLLRKPPLWEWYSIALSLVVTVVCLEITHNLRRRLTLTAVFRLRPRWRKSDASKPVTAHSQDTVQDLVKVEACSGPFVQFVDGRLAMILRIQPPPTVCTAPEDAESLRLRFQRALKRAAQAGAEVMIYQEVEPDLNRSEMDRNMGLAEKLPLESGLRLLVTQRQHFHGEVALEWGRRLAYHVRLSIRPDQVPVAASADTEAERTEAVLNHLRDVAMGMAEEIGHDGLKVQPLGSEGVRNLMARQLDPAGWRMTEPVQGTEWAWAAGAKQPVMGEPAQITDSKQEVGGDAWRHSGPRLALGTLASAAHEAAPRQAEPTPAPHMVEPVAGAPQPGPQTVTGFSAPSTPVAPPAPVPVTRLAGPVGLQGGRIGFPIGAYRGMIPGRDPSGRRR